MAIKNNFPSVRPTLNLDFVNSKAIDPRITFSRASTATYFDEFGVMQTAPAGVPRIDYDPVTGECRGLLVEEQRTNLLSYSEEFANVNWVKTELSVSPNSSFAPDGTLTADKLVETAVANGTHLVYVYTGSAATHAASFYMKAGERSWVNLRIDNTSNYFNLSSGEKGTTAAGNIANIEHVGNGWYCCSVVKTMSGTSPVGLRLAIADGVDVYTGDGTSGIYIWGAQLEQGSFPTSYIPSSVTFTGRASAGTYFGSDGLIKTAASGEARYQYNPLNLKLAPKLLLEEQRTNLLLYSEQFDNAAWVKSRASIEENAANSPDGTLTADKLIGSVDFGEHFTSQVKSLTSGSVYTQSVYVKAGEYKVLRLQGTQATFGTYSQVNADFDLGVGTVSRKGSLVLSVEILNIGGGWFRCSMTAQAIATNLGSIYPILHNGTSTEYVGDGISGIYIWGAQLEEGSYPTSYIKTEAAQVTRVADSSTSSQTTRSGDTATMTGASFSDWYRQDEGTFAVDYSLDVSSSAFPSAWSVTGTGGDAIYHVVNAGGRNIRYEYRKAGSLEKDVGISNTSANVKTAFCYGQGSISQSTLGRAVTSNSPVSIIDVDNFNIGQRNNTSRLNGHIRRIAYYPRRITNDQLQALTSI